MSFDAWIVGFGLSGVLRQLHLVESNAAYLLFVAVVILDIWLLYRFFSMLHATDTAHDAAVNPAAGSPG